MRGISDTYVGVVGQSPSGTGVLGIHLDSAGSNSGVVGRTFSTDPASAGVTGDNRVGGPGLQAIVANNTIAPLRVNSSARVANLNADLLDGLNSSGFWQLGGNAGTTPGTDFLGTSDNQALELKVNGQRALRLEPDATSPNVIGGFSGNSAAAGVFGATIAGGGETGFPNTVSANFGSVGGGLGNTASAPASAVAGGASNTASGNGFSTVAGGNANTASGNLSTVAGGTLNTASGILSFAAGRQAKATQFGSFVWGDSSPFDIGSNGDNTFTARTTGGARFISAIDAVTGAPTAGVTLAPGGGSWASLSDRNAKEGFTPVDKQTLLRRLAGVPIERWSYKAQGSSIVHMGPTAQDFSRAFGLGEDNRHITTIDADGVALAAIQGLYKQNQALQRENRTMQRENRTLRAQLSAQNARLTKLEQAFSKFSR
jgi:Chaperone of endosialidase